MNYYLINAVLLGDFQRAEVNWQPVGPADVWRTSTLSTQDRRLCFINLSQHTNKIYSCTNKSSSHMHVCVCTPNADRSSLSKLSNREWSSQWIKYLMPKHEGLSSDPQ